MGRIRTAIAATVVGAAIAAPGAARADHRPSPPTTTTTRTRLSRPASRSRRSTLLPSGEADPAAPRRSPAEARRRKPPSNGGTKGRRVARTRRAPQRSAAPRRRRPAPLVPTACGPVAIPAYLGPIYQAAAQAYDLGPAGPSILAAINEIESGFGQNLGPSSAGAEGWMQFMPSTWATYGVDADQRRHQGPEQPERRDLRRGPLPARRRHARGPRGRGLRLQPRRLVRRRGHGAGRLLQRDRQRRASAGSR